MFFIQFRESEKYNLHILTAYFTLTLRSKNPHYALHNSGFCALIKRKLI